MLRAALFLLISAVLVTCSGRDQDKSKAEQGETVVITSDESGEACVDQLTFEISFPPVQPSVGRAAITAQFLPGSEVRGVPRLFMETMEGPIGFQFVVGEDASPERPYELTAIIREGEVTFPATIVAGYRNCGEEFRQSSTVSNPLVPLRGLKPFLEMDNPGCVQKDSPLVIRYFLKNSTEDTAYAISTMPQAIVLPGFTVLLVDSNNLAYQLTSNVELEYPPGYNYQWIVPQGELSLDLQVRVSASLGAGTYKLLAYPKRLLSTVSPNLDLFPEEERQKVLDEFPDFLASIGSEGSGQSISNTIWEKAAQDAFTQKCGDPDFLENNEIQHCRIDLEDLFRFQELGQANLIPEPISTTVADECG